MIEINVEGKEGIGVIYIQWIARDISAPPSTLNM